MTKKILSPDEVDFYTKNGYVIPRFRLSDSDLRGLHKCAEKLISDNPNSKGPNISPTHIANKGDGTLPKTDGSIMKYVAHPDILDMVEQVIGPDIIIWVASIWHRQPNTGTTTPWHQDAEYLPIRPMKAVSIWTALTKITADMGGLRVIRGSAAKGLLPHIDPIEMKKNTFGREISAEFIDETDIVEIELEAGQMVLFDVYCTHGAASNRGTRARLNSVARYMPASSLFDLGGRGVAFGEENGEALNDSPLVLVRGINRAANELHRGPAS